MNAGLLLRQMTPALLINCLRHQLNPLLNHFHQNGNQQNIKEVHVQSDKEKEVKSQINRNNQLLQIFFLLLMEFKNYLMKI